MPEPCIFCDNNSGSREHLWPKWIHERKDFGPLKIQRGKSKKVVIPHPEVTGKTVCGICNNGWMSDLEAENIPIIGNMLQDVTLPLRRSSAEDGWSHGPRRERGRRDFRSLVQNGRLGRVDHSNLDHQKANRPLASQGDIHERRSAGHRTPDGPLASRRRSGSSHASLSPPVRAVTSCPIPQNGSGFIQVDECNGIFATATGSNA